MAVSEAQKKATAKYQKENMATIACKLRKEQAEKFRDYCESIGQSPNAVVKEYVLSCINQEVSP